MFTISDWPKKYISFSNNTMLASIKYQSRNANSNPTLKNQYNNFSRRLISPIKTNQVIVPANYITYYYHQ